MVDDKTVFPGWYVLENSLGSCLLPTCYATSDMIIEYKVEYKRRVLPAFF